MERDISTEWVDVKVNDENETSVMPAYLARPAIPGMYPNVLLGFELFGVTSYVRAVAERIAHLGYNALVPDFYHRLGRHIELTDDVEGRTRGFEPLAGIHRDGVRRDVQAAITHLRTQAGSSDRTALLGLSTGGHIAYYVATQVPFAALIVCYPGWLTSSTTRRIGDECSSARCPTPFSGSMPCGKISARGGPMSSSITASAS